MSYYGTGFFSSTSGNSGWYSNWAGLRNGSYGRMVKSYYSGLHGSGSSVSGKSTSTSTSKSTSAGKEYVLDRLLREKMYPTPSKKAQEANDRLTSGISGLADSVSVLQNKNTYQDTAGKTDAADKVAAAVKNYVSGYNDVVSASKDSTLTNKTAYIAGMMRSSQTNADKLAQIGVTVNKDGTLTLDEDKLKAADISKVQELFSGDNIVSYGSIVKSRLGFAGISSGTTAGTDTEKDERDKAAKAGTKNLMEDIEKFTADDAFLKPYSKKDVRKAFREIDIADIYATTKSFVNHYNSLIDAAKGSTNSGVTSNLAALMEKTEQNKDSLKQFGIDVDENGNMTLDEDRLRKGEAHSSISIERFFKNYASSISNNVSLIDYYMKTQADAASGYTANGAYNAQGSSLFDIAV